MNSAAHVTHLLEAVQNHALSDRQHAAISALALLGVDMITRSTQDMQERARVLIELMGD